VIGQGRIRQAMNPYSLDSVLRIVHSLVLARRGEFLVHAASVILRGRAFLVRGCLGRRQGQQFSRPRACRCDPVDG